MDVFDIAIIGNGFCSLATAANLIRLAVKPLSVAVIGAEAQWGPGLAYGRCEFHHLLNVPAGKMGAYADAPDDFLNWVQLKTNYKESGARDFHESFLPRSLYGEYLEQVAADTVEAARRGGHTLKYIQARAYNISFENNIFNISAGGQKIRAKKTVLAAGVPQAVSAPDDPKPYMADPWKTDFSVFKDAKAPVVILGLGLTMIDVVASLSRRKFKGKIIAVSRRGLLPRVHADSDGTKDVEKVAGGLLPLEGTLAEKMRRLRANAAVCAGKNIPWQWYMDYVRRRTPELWAALSLPEQKHFLKRAAPYWNIHRHRQPEESAALLQHLKDSGQLIMGRGPLRWEIDKTLSVTCEGKTFEHISHVFNCRGPDYSLRGDALLDQLLRDKFIERHENGLGVKIDETLSAIGKARGALYVAGSLTTGTFLDSTSVPELRSQCVKIANELVTSS